MLRQRNRTAMGACEASKRVEAKRKTPRPKHPREFSTLQIVELFHLVWFCSQVLQ